MSAGGGGGLYQKQKGFNGYGYDPLLPREKQPEGSDLLPVKPAVYRDLACPG